MKDFNVTAQVYKLDDCHKQNLLINQVFAADSPEDAIQQFKNFYSSSIEFYVVKIHSAEEIPQEAS